MILCNNCLCHVLYIFNDWMTNPDADCYWNIKCEDCTNDVFLYIKKILLFPLIRYQQKYGTKNSSAISQLPR